MLESPILMSRRCRIYLQSALIFISFTLNHNCLAGQPESIGPDHLQAPFCEHVFYQHNLALNLTPLRFSNGKIADRQATFFTPPKEHDLGQTIKSGNPFLIINYGQRQTLLKPIDHVHFIRLSLDGFHLAEKYGGPRILRYGQIWGLPYDGKTTALPIYFIEIEKVEFGSGSFTFKWAERNNSSIQMARDGFRFDVPQALAAIIRQTIVDQIDILADPDFIISRSGVTPIDTGEWRNLGTWVSPERLGLFIIRHIIPKNEFSLQFALSLLEEIYLAPELPTQYKNELSQFILKNFYTESASDLRELTQLTRLPINAYYIEEFAAKLLRIIRSNLKRKDRTPMPGSKV